MKDFADHFAEGLVPLDVHLLNEKVLKPILGIKNIRTDKRIKYVEGTRDIADLENTPDKSGQVQGVTFTLFPVEFEDLKAVVDAQGTMPPKSTFFEPRLKNGLLVYEI